MEDEPSYPEVIHNHEENEDSTHTINPLVAEKTQLVVSSPTKIQAITPPYPERLEISKTTPQPNLNL